MSTSKKSNPSASTSQSRRQMLKSVAGAAALSAAGPLLTNAWAAGLKGTIHHSVCLWCYSGYLKEAKMSLDQFAAACVKLGLKSVELTTPAEWTTLKKQGLI